ncbi:unnamed protein product [Colias eurytheme]|nr:unnamed protein product [Colias eurytheme]
MNTSSPAPASPLATMPPIPISPLSSVSDRLVVDAIHRASLTRRPSCIKYPSDFFDATEHSSSSSEEEKVTKSKKKADKNSQ